MRSPLCLNKLNIYRTNKEHRQGRAIGALEREERELGVLKAAVGQGLKSGKPIDRDVVFERMRKTRQAPECAQSSRSTSYNCVGGSCPLS